MVEDYLVLELQPYEQSMPEVLAQQQSTDIRLYEFGNIVRQSFSEMAAVRSVVIRLISDFNFDRVLAYQIDFAGHGQVVEECCSSDSQERWQDVVYPKSSIPPHARVLLAKTGARYYPGGEAAGVSQLVPASLPGLCASTEVRALALSRPHAPCQVHYNRAVSVASSLTLAVMVDMRLWGVIICHHHGMPRSVGPADRCKAIAMARALSHRLTELHMAQVRVHMQDCTAALANASLHQSSERGWVLPRAVANVLLTSFSADAVSIVKHDSGSVESAMWLRVPHETMPRLQLLTGPDGISWQVQVQLAKALLAVGEPGANATGHSILSFQRGSPADLAAPSDAPQDSSGGCGAGCCAPAPKHSSSSAEAAAAWAACDGFESPLSSGTVAVCNCVDALLHQYLPHVHAAARAHALTVRGVRMCGVLVLPLHDGWICCWRTLHKFVEKRAVSPEPRAPLDLGALMKVVHNQCRSWSCLEMHLASELFPHLQPLAVSSMLTAHDDELMEEQFSHNIVAARTLLARPIMSTYMGDAGDFQGRHLSADALEELQLSGGLSLLQRSRMLHGVGSPEEGTPPPAQDMALSQVRAGLHEARQNRFLGLLELRHLQPAVFAMHLLHKSAQRAISLLYSARSSLPFDGALFWWAGSVTNVKMPAGPGNDTWQKARIGQRTCAALNWGHAADTSPGSGGSLRLGQVMDYDSWYTAAQVWEQALVAPSPLGFVDFKGTSAGTRDRLTSGGAPEALDALRMSEDQLMTLLASCAAPHGRHRATVQHALQGGALASTAEAQRALDAAAGPGQYRFNMLSEPPSAVCACAEAAAPASSSCGRAVHASGSARDEAVSSWVGGPCFCDNVSELPPWIQALVQSECVSMGSFCVCWLGAGMFMLLHRREATQWTRAQRVAVGAIHSTVQQLVAAAMTTAQDLVLRELQAQQELQSRDAEMKQNFVAHISHELRTPFVGILSSLDLLLASQLNSEQQYMASTARQSATDLLRLLDDVLDLARANAAGFAMRKTQFSPLRAAVNVVEALHGNAVLHGVEVAVHAPPNLADIALVGDAGRMRQMMTNLLGNALKHVQAGGYAVLDLRMLRPGLMQVAVKDNGPGVPLHLQSRLFQPFSIGEEPTTRRSKGTGLGLALVAKFAKLMGGDVALQSVPGEGATFSFTVQLPEVQNTLALAPACSGDVARASWRCVEEEAGKLHVCILGTGYTADCLLPNMLREAPLPLLSTVVQWCPDDIPAMTAAVRELASRHPGFTVLAIVFDNNNQDEIAVVAPLYRACEDLLRCALALPVSRTALVATDGSETELPNTPSPSAAALLAGASSSAARALLAARQAAQAEWQAEDKLIAVHGVLTYPKLWRAIGLQGLDPVAGARTTTLADGRPRPPAAPSDTSGQNSVQQPAARLPGGGISSSSMSTPAGSHTVMSEQAGQALGSMPGPGAADQPAGIRDATHGGASESMASACSAPDATSSMASSTQHDESAVLVVDDTTVNRRMLSKMVELAGKKAQVAGSGTKALEMMISEHDHLCCVLMDYHMPGVDGMEATARLRAAEAAHGLTRLPVLLCTADSHFAEGESGSGLVLFTGDNHAPKELKNFDGVIVKPVTRECVQAACTAFQV